MTFGGVCGIGEADTERSGTAAASTKSRRWRIEVSVYLTGFPVAKMKGERRAS